MVRISILLLLRFVVISFIFFLLGSVHYIHLCVPGATLSVDEGSNFMVLNEREQVYSSTAVPYLIIPRKKLSLGKAIRAGERGDGLGSAPGSSLP